MKKIRYIAEAILLALVLGISKMMPALWASNLGAWIGRNIGARLAASRKAMANIQRIYPDKSDDEARQLTNAMWENLGRVIMEYPHIKNIAKNHTEIIGIERFNNHFTRSAGVGAPIFISAHLGNWEVCPPAFLLQTGIKVHPVYRAPNNRFVDVLLNKKRSVEGALTPIPKSQEGTRRIIKLLKHGKEGKLDHDEGVGLLIDQKYNEGVVADFMGYPAKTSDHFITLSRKFNAPIIPLHIERINAIQFKITVCDVIDSTDKSNEEILSNVHNILESWINKRPEQWLWLHRRWMNPQEIKREIEKQK